MDEPLFRKEVLAERKAQWFGTVLLVPRLSESVFAAFALCATSAILGLLFFSSYTHKSRIGGWLVPKDGMLQVYSPIAGVINEIAVAEGSRVSKGDRLLVISAELQSSAVGATQSEVGRKLAARRDSLVEQKAQLSILAAQQQRSLEERVAMLKSEDEQLGREIYVQRERLSLSRKSEERQEKLHGGSLISDEQFQTVREGRLDQDARLQVLQRTRLGTRRDLITLSGELRDLPIKSEAEGHDVDRNIAALEQEMAEAEAKREIVVPAPESGTVTAIFATRGGRPSSGVPLLSIVPAGSELEAQLFVPSRAAGFLRTGQNVLLRYEAYPYQKFGHYEGTVETLSRSSVNPSELPPQLAGMTSLIGTGEPVYRITVKLERQTITAYGEAVPLSPGMQVEADVAIERRKLIEWVLDPLYTITGKWKK